MQRRLLCLYLRISCLCAYWTGSLHFWKIYWHTYICYWKVHIVYRSTYAPIQIMLFQLNCRVSIRIAQNRCSMWTDQPAVREHHETKNTTKKTEDCWTARVLYQTRMGEHFSSTSPAAALLSCLQSVVKSRADATQWETRPCPNFFETRCCHQIQYEPRFFFKWFKYLILSVFYFE